MATRNKMAICVILFLNSIFLHSMEQKDLMDIEYATQSDLANFETLPAELRTIILIKLIENSDTYQQSIKDICSLYAINKENQFLIKNNIKYILKAISSKYGLISILNLPNLHPIFHKAFQEILQDKISIQEICRFHTLMEPSVSLSTFMEKNPNTKSFLLRIVSDEISPEIKQEFCQQLAAVDFFSNYAFNILEIIINLTKFIYNEQIYTCQKDALQKHFYQLLSNALIQKQLPMLTSFSPNDFILKAIEIFEQHDSFNDIAFRNLNTTELANFPEISLECNFRAIACSIKNPNLKNNWVKTIHESIDSFENSFCQSSIFAEIALDEKNNTMTKSEREQLDLILFNMICQRYIYPLLELSLSFLENCKQFSNDKATIVDIIQHQFIKWPQMSKIKDQNLKNFINQQKIELIKCICQNNLFLKTENLIVDSIKTGFVTDWKSLITLAIEANFKEFIEYLLAKGLDINKEFVEGTMLTIAANLMNKDLTNFLLVKGANLNNVIRQRKILSPLMMAVKNNDLMQVVEFLKNGADPNFRSGWYKESPILIASSPEIANELLKYKARIVLDKMGATVLSIAAQKNDLKMIKFWLNQNVDINKQDRHGKTALMKVTQKKIGKFETVKFLIENGYANMDLKDKRGNTALSLAKKFSKSKSQDKQEIINYLKKLGAKDRAISNL